MQQDGGTRIVGERRKEEKGREGEGRGIVRESII